MKRDGEDIRQIMLEIRIRKMTHGCSEGYEDIRSASIFVTIVMIPT